ncbi:MAG: CAAX prenyl protease-related protein [Pirellulales bacterium]|nr:CAAX prenyl protease-related protein [Pirellulales bacterium]
MADETSAATPPEATTTNRALPRWAVFVVPFVVYMLCNSLEPAAPVPGEPAPESRLGISIGYEHYPLVYTFKLAATLVAMAIVWPGYRAFPWRVNWLAPVVGLVGAVLWIALCQPAIQDMLRDWLTAVGLGEMVSEKLRAGFNPLEQLAAHPAWAWGFLLIRFFGLSVIVPWIEEYFIRGFLLRFLGGAEWWQTPFGTYQGTALAITTLFFAATHPLTELAGALAWFSLVSWLMLWTRNIWDCVVAHGVTNLAMGIYVVATGAWYLM